MNLKHVIAAGLIAASLSTTGAVIAGTASTTASAKATHHAHKHRSMGLPPFWHRQPPRWCGEDMVCWIGSAEDGRSAKIALADWRDQMHHAEARTNRYG